MPNTATNTPRLSPAARSGGYHAHLLIQSMARADSATREIRALAANVLKGLLSTHEPRRVSAHPGKAMVWFAVGGKLLDLACVQRAADRAKMAAGPFSMRWRYSPANVV